MINAAIAAVAFCFAFGVTAALGATQQGYSEYHGFHYAYVNIDARSFNPGAHKCVVYSTLIYDRTNTGQVEAGQLGCSAWVVDKTCYNGHFVSESATPDNHFTCLQGGTFNTWTDYTTLVNRVGTEGYAMAGDGTKLPMFTFGANDLLVNMSWVEDIGEDMCPGTGNSANFNTWQYQGADMQLHYASDASQEHAYGAGGRCWTVSSAISGTGAFNVSR